MLVSFLMLVLLSGVIGAVIGAGTNELAIRYIFWKLIPAKKRELAESIQEVISTNLMSADKIAERMQSEQVQAVITHNVTEFVNDMLDKDFDSVVRTFSGREAAVLSVAQHVRALAMREIEQRLLTREFAETAIAPQVARYLDEIWRQSPQELLPAVCSDVIAFAPARVADFLKSAAFRDTAAATLGRITFAMLSSERRVASVMSDSARAVLDAALRDQTPALLVHIAGILRTAPIQQALSASIRAALHRQLDQRNVFTKMVAKYLVDVDKNVDELCAALPDRLMEDFRETVTCERIADALVASAHALMDKPFCELFAGVTPQQATLFVAQLLAQLLTNETCNSIGKDAAKLAGTIAVRALGESFAALNVPVEREAVRRMTLDKIAGALQAEYVHSLIEEHLCALQDDLLARRVGRLRRFISPPLVKEIAGMLSAATQELIAQRITGFTDNAGLWDIVNDSILAYDNKEIEQLVRRICNRELVWVTVLGGIIGFVVGVIQGTLTDLWYR
ncbi:MAG: DUF445 family protein [bacterium]|nr:DUF445 family protein [bacterium]